jgi:mannobiose 2-epimerase
MRLVERIESVGHDNVNGGYFETFERDWTESADQRLSEVDMDEKKSMNTHLHLLEAYATLLHYREDSTVRLRLRELIEIFLKHIIDPTSHHFVLFFDEQWHPRSEVISFGHDIEGSWLLCEAAEILGDSGALKRVRNVAVKMAQAVYDQGLDTDGGLLYEANSTSIIDDSKQWWPQAEAVVGFLNVYESTGRRHFMDAAERSWAFIEKHIVDRKHGEWFWLVSRAGAPEADKDKVGPWKCPYHNSRTCFEVMERLDARTRAHPVARN